MPWLAQGNPAVLLVPGLGFLRFHLLLFSQSHTMCTWEPQKVLQALARGSLGTPLNTPLDVLASTVALLSVPNPQPILRGLFANSIL